MRTPSDPEAAKLRSKQLDFFLIGLLLLLVAGIVFQFFLRYAYVHTTGTTVVRVDRVSGDSCTVPCDENGYGTRTMPYVPAPTPVPAKVCHGANVVRVARALAPPATRTMTPYIEGGPHTPSVPPRTASVALAKHRAHAVHHPHGRALSDAVELSDGHVYVFARDVFAADVATWTTGQDVQVCSTLSRLENRPYYSVGASEDAEPANLAL